MNTPPDHLFQLLPYYYRALDEKEGGHALHDLLGVMGEQFGVVEGDLDQLYDDWFIETCADWVVPYLGDLVGWQAVQGGGVPKRKTEADLLRWLAPRRDVANTLRHRRRKGTLPLLEELARDVAGWPALAVEAGFREWLLGRTAEVHRHLDAAVAPRTGAPSLVDIPDPLLLAPLGTPSDKLAHTIDVRRTEAAAQPPLNLPSVALHVWRLPSFPVTCTMAGDNPPGSDIYRFSALGNDTPLFTPPAGAGDLAVPRALTREEISERLAGDATEAPRRVAADFYGPGKAFAIYAPDWPTLGAPQPVPRECIIPADLGGWNDAARPPEGCIAVDPERGRLAFSEGGGPDPDKGVFVSWHMGFSAPMGGGEYRRPLAQQEGAVIYRLSRRQSLEEGLALWEAERDTVKDAILEFESSGVYNANVHLRLRADETLQVRAAQGARPILQLRKAVGHGPGMLLVEMEPGAALVLDGLLISDGPLRLRHLPAPAPAHECPAAVIIRHCTLVPGWSFDCDCHLQHADKDSIELAQYLGTLAIQRSIVGSISVSAQEDRTDPVPMEISDSIVDAAGSEQMAFYDDNYSIANPDEGPFAHATLTIRRSTIFGRVRVHALPLAENCIFRDGVCVARRQPGCLRFCWVAPCARTPRRYECQPEEAMRQAAGPGGSGAQCDCEPADCAAEEALRRVRPWFVSERYGHPAYAQLHLSTAEEIRRGADDRSEMGAFHDLFQPQREANLRARLAEFTPAAATAALVFQS